MNGEWKIKKLSDVIVNFDTRRKPVKESDRKKGFYPYYGASGIVDYVDDYIFDGDYLLVAEDGENLRTRQTPIAFIASGKFWVNNHAHILRGNEMADTRYLQYAILGTDITAYLTGAVMPKLTQGNLNRIEILCPPIKIQKQIVGVLGSLDDRITLLRETNKTLEAIAQALFKSWFIDFDPVRAKMENKIPEGMDEETAALFPDSLEESELGMIPKGWKVGQISDIGNVICGKTPPTSESKNYGSDIPFITIPDMHNFLLITSTNRFLSKKGADTQKNKYLPRGSICVSCIATPGLVAQVTKESQTNQQINSVIPFLSWGNNFSLFLLRRIGEAVRTGGSGGSVFHNLNKSDFELLPVLLVEKKLAQKFDFIVQQLVEKIEVNQKQAQTLANLRDTLLPRLISGQIRVGDLKSE